MSEDCTDAGEGRTLSKHGSGCGVPQDVGTVAWRLDPGPKYCPVHDLSDSRTRQRAKWSKYRSEHLVYLQRWSSLVHIEQKGVADLLW